MRTLELVLAPILYETEIWGAHEGLASSIDIWSVKRMTRNYIYICREMLLKRSNFRGLA